MVPEFGPRHYIPPPSGHHVQRRDRVCLAEPQPPQGLAVRAGRLFDPRSGVNLLNQVILIKGDKITAVGPASSVQIPAGARVIDLSKDTVLPGMIDGHLHYFNSAPQPGHPNVK